MPDQNLNGPVPQAPDLSNIAASPYAAKAEKKPTETPDIGYANKGAQVASGITGVLQGLQQGFAQKQVEKFNRAKTDYSISKAQYDAASARVAQLRAQGSDPNSDDFKSAQAHLDQAKAELTTNTQSLVDLAHGGGGKGKNSDPAHQGIIGKAMDILMGKVHPTQHSNPVSTPATFPSTPQAPSTGPNPIAIPETSAGTIPL